MPRIFNFSAGPCTLPLEALEAAKAQFSDYQNLGMGLVEMSHRTKPVEAMHQAALDSTKALLGVPDTHQILLLGGGATLQFAMAPMNLLAGGKKADYTNTGAWAKKAIDDAKKFGELLKQTNPDSEVVIYPGVGHGFFADYRPSYNAEAAADAWKRCTGLFAKSLKA